MVHIKKSFWKKTTKIPCYLLVTTRTNPVMRLIPLMSIPTRPRTHRPSFKSGSLIPIPSLTSSGPLCISWDTFTCPLEPGSVSQSVQSLSRVQLFVTPWTAAHQASLSITNSQSLLKLMSIESVMPSNHLIPSPPACNLSSIRVFSNESVLHIRWPKYWNFSFSISTSSEYSRLISFRMDWLDLLAIQGTLKNLLQHHSSKAPIIWCSAFFIVQLSHPYMTTGKTITLTRQTFVGKVMSLLFNMMSRLVIACLPRSKQASFNFMAAITICSDFGAPKDKVCYCFHWFPIYLPWSGISQARILQWVAFSFSI